MLIYVKFSCIFQSPDLVDIPWSISMSGRTNMVSTYQFNRFKYSTPMFSYIFLLNRTIFVRVTSFQQVLLSSSGPKENISISKFIYP